MKQVKAIAGEMNLPWRLSDPEYYFVNDCNGETVARTGLKNEATYIIKSCNHFPELVSAMQGFVDNVISNPKLYENQISYYKGLFNKLLTKIEQ